MRLIVGGLVPLALVLGVILFVPASLGTLLGISLKSWALFACAPATSLLLRLALGGRDETGDEAGGEAGA